MKSAALLLVACALLLATGASASKLKGQRCIWLNPVFGSCARTCPLLSMRHVHHPRCAAAPLACPCTHL